MAAHRNNKTGKIYQVLGLVVDSNNSSRGKEEAEILYRPLHPDDAVFYRRKRSEFMEKFTQVSE
jgi:hypothetical protein